MNKETIKEFMPLMQAILDGKTIQYYSEWRRGWVDTEEILVDGNVPEYRIKPEPKYRPFKNAEECWTEMQKHQPFGWVKDRTANEYVLITTVENDGDITIYNKIGWKFNNIILRFTFADGAPFGVKEEE